MAAVKRSREAVMLLARGLTDDDVVRMAVGLYALFRTVNALRFGAARQSKDPSVLLRMFSKRAVDYSPGGKLIRRP